MGVKPQKTGGKKTRLGGDSGWRKIRQGAGAVPPMVERAIRRETQDILAAAWELARGIFSRPEPAYEEHQTAAALARFLSEAGFRLERDLAGLPTAFQADLPSRPARPAVAFLSEMDALPGLGHACGHHLIAAGSAAAGVVLSRVIQPRTATIKVIGCPAEEAGGGKVRLTRAGVFSGLDAALLVHPERTTEIYKRSFGMVEIKLEMFGKSAHAAAEPEEGKNALDAILLAFNAVALMRQQMPEWNRVHGIITHGGRASNIIPDYTSAVFLARGHTVKETLELADRVVRCTQGAARAAGCRLRSRVLRRSLYAPYFPNRALGETFRQALQWIGEPVAQGPEDKGMGSTDVGNVGLAAPVLHPMMAVPGARDGCHTPAFAEAAGGPGGKIMLEKSILALAWTGAAVLLDVRLRQAIHREHRNIMKTIQ